ncbi:MAG: TusE/DsrC/DsvC family sulfur relay protein [Chromatiaceae bacterium]|nr:TusE/DsrC/DsvC family sulfur relay protein [Chromatiaceae bacterium]
MSNPSNSIVTGDPVSEPVDRHQDPVEWDRQEACMTARRLGIEMTREHWWVILFLRQIQVERDIPREARKLAAMLDAAFIDEGGMRWLYTLFPGGPVLQGCAIAGVPIPDTPSKTFPTSAGDTRVTRSARARSAQSRRERSFRGH